VEQIVAKLTETEKLQEAGMTIPQACKKRLKLSSSRRPEIPHSGPTSSERRSQIPPLSLCGGLHAGRHRKDAGTLFIFEP
jgi:hypothetical protein